MRLMGLFGRARVRWGALNVVLYWTFFAAMLTELVTGAMLYLGHGGSTATIHRYATWVIIAYAFAHVLLQFVLGGVPQVLRIFRPALLAPPAPPFDPLDLIDLAQAPPSQAAEHTAAPRPVPTAVV